MKSQTFNESNDFTDEDDDNSADSDVELQEAFAKGLLKPGLNVVSDAPKTFVNNAEALKKKLLEFKLDLPWVESLDCLNKQAPMAPELAAQIHEQEQKRDHLLRNNKKLSAANLDPVLNDFKREMTFHRQAQAAVLNMIPRIKAMGLPTKRPDDYFAEMAKSDDHMQKIRENLMRRENKQKNMEKVKQLRIQRKEGKAMQKQSAFKAQQDKKEMLDKIKKVRKGISKDLSFLDDNRKNRPGGSKKALQKRAYKDKKFGFGGKKKGSKMNEANSSADVSEFRRPHKPGKPSAKGGKRLGKNRRVKSKNNSKRKTK